MSTDNIIVVGNNLAAGNFGSPMQLIILLVIVLLLFGGNRLRNLGGDLGSAIKGFKKSMGDGEKKENDEEELPPLADENMKLEKIINPEATSKVSKPTASAEKVVKPSPKVSKPKVVKEQK